LVSLRLMTKFKGKLLALIKLLKYKWEYEVR
jgi:hypothetical protein